MLKLYFNPRSTFSRRVHISLLEKGIPFEPVVLDMAAKAHKAKDYLAKNPYGRVPSIDDGGFVLYESTAILNYLEATHPTPALVPSDAKGRALVDMYMKLCDIQMGVHIGAVFFPKRFLPKDRWDLEAMKTATAAIEAHFEVLRTQLAGKTYLVGEKFSLADLVYLPFLQFLPLLDFEPPPAIRDWAARLLERESAKQTVPEQ